MVVVVMVGGGVAVETTMIVLVDLERERGYKIGVV